MFYSIAVSCLLTIIFGFMLTCGGILHPSGPKDLLSNEVHHRHRYWSYHAEKHPKNFTFKDVQLGCRELRSKKYISDGYCTSIKPILEVVCAGVCLPIADLPFYNQLLERKSYREVASQWRCMNGRVNKEKAHLICHDGTERSYKVRLVKSCKCKKHKKSPYHPFF